MPTRHSLDGADVTAVPPEFALHPYGVFTTFVAVEGTVLGWRQHASRLAEGAAELWGHQLDHSMLGSVVRSHLSGASDPAVSVRVTLYPQQFILTAPDEAAGCRVLVSSAPAGFPFGPVPDLAVQCVQHTRDAAHLKSTDLFTQIRLRRQARLGGRDDALFVSDELVREGTTWSVLVWHGAQVVTPDTDVLDSITVMQLAAVASELGRELVRRPVRRSELCEAELVLAVNVNNPARAIGAVDGLELPADRGLLERVAAAYSALPREQIQP